MAKKVLFDKSMEGRRLEKKKRERDMEDPSNLLCLYFMDNFLAKVHWHDM